MGNPAGHGGGTPGALGTDPGELAEEPTLNPGPMDRMTVLSVIPRSCGPGTCPDPTRMIGVSVAVLAREAPSCAVRTYLPGRCPAVALARRAADTRATRPTDGFKLGGTLGAPVGLDHADPPFLGMKPATASVPHRSATGGLLAHHRGN